MPSLDDMLGAMILENPLPDDQLNGTDFHFENNAQFEPSSLSKNHNFNFTYQTREQAEDNVDSEFDTESFDCLSNFTIEFTNSKVAPNSTSNWRRPRKNNVNAQNDKETRERLAADEIVSNFKTDSEFEDKIIDIPKLEYDSCFEEFLNSYNSRTNITTNSHLQRALKDQDDPWKRQDKLINLDPITEMPEILKDISERTSKSQINKASKFLLRELRKHILDLDKLEINTNNDLLQSSKQAALDFKQLRQTVIDREAEVLSGLRRMKENIGKTIRRQRGFCQNLQKSIESSNGDFRKLRDYVESYQRILNVTSELPSSKENTIYQFTNLNDVAGKIKASAIIHGRTSSSS